MTKKTPAKKNGTIPGVEFYTEGKGRAEQTRWRVSSDNMTPEAIEFIKKLQASRPGDTGFDRSIFPVERAAKRTLEAAGLPSDPACRYNIPGGEKITSPGGIGGWGNLTSLVEAKGYRKREHLEWFSAEILRNIHSARGYIAAGDAVQAAVAGALVGVLFGLAKATGYTMQTGKDGGSKDKKIRPVVEWLRRTIKQYPDKPCTFYWNSLPEHDDGGTVEEINGATMIREGNVLVVTDDDGRKRTLTEKSFGRYVAIVKESPKK